MTQESRVDSEWIALNAFRELLKLSTKGDLSKATYDAKGGLFLYPFSMDNDHYIALSGPFSVFDLCDQL
jgi:hypothetical protein